MKEPLNMSGKSPCFQIWYEPQHCLLRLHWQALSSFYQIQQCVPDVLERLQKEQIQGLLLDLDGMPDLSAMDQYWLEVRCLAGLPNLPLQHLALVLTSHTQHQMLLEVSLRQPAFEIQVFDDADTALDWLRSSAALQAAAGAAGLSASVAA
ncbi:hypothetical protein GCM10027348_25140 [Hymenobacter tenuis]